jgi:hypothetical protein
MLHKLSVVNHDPEVRYSRTVQGCIALRRPLPEAGKRNLEKESMEKARYKYACYKRRKLKTRELKE